jgi:hypothetical protein
MDIKTKLKYEKVARIAVVCILVALVLWGLVSLLSFPLALEVIGTVIVAFITAYASFALILWLGGEYSFFD